MTVPLQLPSFTALELEARRCLGRGRRLAYGLDSESGTLTLVAEPGETALDFALATRLGTLRLEHPGAVLSLLGDCPVEPGTSESGQDWYWALISAALASELGALLGELRPQDPAAVEDAPPLLLRLTAERGGSRASTRLVLAAPTLMRLLEAAPWCPLPAPALPDLPLQLPLVLARLELSRQQLGQLAIGDLLRPAETIFAPDGSGTLAVGHWRIVVRLLPLQGLITLDILSIEELAMDLSTSPDALDDEESPLALPAREAEPFDELPLPLTLRCGQLRLSLGALRDLAPGMLLPVPEVQPGSATLCYGERPVAQGELVEVEGRLALQITRVDLA